jgi:dihydrofolate reductase
MSNTIPLVYVVAVAKGGVIGAQNTLPWRLKSDLAFFKRVTTGKPLLMGRKTWESLPRRPLPGRENIVITRQADYAAPGAHLVADVEAGVKLARAFAARDGASEVAVIGGGEIFTALLGQTARIYLTEVDYEVEGDTFFPPLDMGQWREISREPHQRGPEDDADFVIRVLERA